jgi:hypothetical protein
MKTGIILALIILPQVNIRAGIFDFFLGKKEKCPSSIEGGNIEGGKVPSSIEMISKEEMEISITSLFSITSDPEIENAFIDEYKSIFKNKCLAKTSVPKGNTIDINSCQDTYKVNFSKINEKLKFDFLYSEKSQDYHYRTIVQLECIKKCPEKKILKKECEISENKSLEQNNSGRSLIKNDKENVPLNKNESSSNLSK